MTPQESIDYLNKEVVNNLVDCCKDLTEFAETGILSSGGIIRRIVKNVDKGIQEYGTSQKLVISAIEYEAVKTIAS